MISPAQRAAALQDWLALPGCRLLPSVWDAGVARLLTAEGFGALETTSAGLAYGFGRPDGLNGVSRAETLASARLILGATPLPVMADLENGFGPAPGDVAETIRLAAETGLSGGSIEDSTGQDDPALFPLGTAVARIAAAAEAARALPHRFHVTARCEGLQRGCLELPAVIRRLCAYAEAGADSLYAPGVASLADLATLCAAVPRPVAVLVGGLGPGVTLAQLEAAGARRASLGSALPRAALGGIRAAARQMREGGSFRFMGDLPSFPETQALMAGG